MTDIVLKGVTKYYRSSEINVKDQLVLDNINLKIKEGDL
jgi:ABC-type multidrug transport system ATPase subunit